MGCGECLAMPVGMCTRLAFVGLSQHDVGVDAAEPKGVHCGHAASATRPVGRLGGKVQAAAVKVGMRRLSVQRWRQYPVVEGQRGFDQSGHTGGRHAMPDHRLDRTQVKRRADVAERGADRGQFGAVARRGGGAVGLDQARLGRVHPRGVPTPSHRQNLAVHPWPQ